MFKTFGRLNVKQRSLRPEGMVWFDPIYRTRSRVNPSRRNWRCYLQMVCHVCVNVNEMCEWDDVWKWVKENERWGGEGRKEERNTNLQVQGHLYQNEPRVIQTSSQTQMNQLQFRWYSTDLFTEVSNTFVIVTAHKQVCANQQSHQVSFQISKLNHKQCNRQAAHLFLQTRIWVGFLARGLVCKRCWIRLAVNRILNFGFRV